MPGMLPVINEGCVALAVKTGLGLKAQINLTGNARDLWVAGIRDAGCPSLCPSATGYL